MTVMVMEARHLARDYRGTRVDDVSFAVVRHRVTGFVGANGAGKSTTLKMLLGLVRPSAGTGQVLGHALGSEKASVAARRKIAYVGEDKNLYAYMSVGELIRFTRSFYDDWRPDEEARLLELYRLPVTKNVKALSKGMRTKLALLLALARRPELLILDEPADGLDPIANEDLLRELAGRSAEGITIFFSSHQLEDVERIADDVIMIDQGRVVLETSLDEMRARYRRVTFDFAAAPPPAGLAMPGVRSTRVVGRQLSAFVTDNVSAVVARKNELGATSVQVSALPLREVFLDRVAAAR